MGTAAGKTDAGYDMPVDLGSPFDEQAAARRVVVHHAVAAAVEDRALADYAADMDCVAGIRPPGLNFPAFDSTTAGLVFLAGHPCAGRPAGIYLHVEAVSRLQGEDGPLASAPYVERPAANGRGLVTWVIGEPVREEHRVWPDRTGLVSAPFGSLGCRRTGESD
jgi:hypothetical protein